MAVNTLIEGNILKINVGGAKVEYWNAAWVGMEFIDSTVAGGGANVVPVFYNGTNWVIG